MFDQPAVTLPFRHITETATASISEMFSNPLWKISAGRVPCRVSAVVVIQLLPCWGLLDQGFIAMLNDMPGWPRFRAGFDGPDRRMTSLVPRPSAVARMTFARAT